MASTITARPLQVLVVDDVAADIFRSLHVKLHVNGVDEAVLAHDDKVRRLEVNLRLKFLSRLVVAILCVNGQVALHAQVKVFKSVIGLNVVVAQLLTGRAAEPRDSHDGDE